MATLDPGNRSRRFFSSIVSILQPGRTGGRHTSTVSTAAAYGNEKHHGRAGSGAGSQGSGQGASGPQDDVDWELRAENFERKRWARTLPPWIHSLEEGEPQDIVDPNAALLPRVPATARGPHHNHMPIPKPRPDGSLAQEGAHEAAAMSGARAEQVSRWQAFARASAYPALHSHIVDEEWMQENLPDFDLPWTPVLPSEQEKGEGFWLFNAEARNAKSERWMRMLMRNPFVPLIVRFIVMAFCAAALALGAWIYSESESLNSSPSLKANTTDTPGTADDYICEQQPSTYMAFSVNSVAILYLFYITWDEYTSKPLGLRRTRAKMRLLFLDLFFIVFSAADISLAFNTLTDQQWSCYRGNPLDANNNNAQAARSTCVYSSDLCARQKALVSMLLTAEVAWLLTFAISVMRVLEKISS